MKKLSTEKQKAVVRALVEGMSINGTVRATGVAKTTILRLIQELGEACMVYHDKHVRGLKPERIETDEIWSFCYAKKKNLPPELDGEFGYGDVWTWTAITDQKLIIAYRVGLRGQYDANQFMLDLAGRITNRTQLTSDGHTCYVEAVENAFGFDVDYAQLVKSYGPNTMDKQNPSEAKYSPPRINGAKKTPVIGLPDRRHISTSHVESNNMTIRMGLRRYTRLTNAHSKKISYHIWTVALFFMYRNYCHKHWALGTSAAVASGLADKIWTLDDLVSLLH